MRFIKITPDILDIFDVCREFGIKLNSRNKSLCPFHKEKTPSFYINKEKNSFCCFGCNISGDAVNLKALLSGRDNKEVFKEVMNGVNNNTLSPDRIIAMNEKRNEDRFDKWVCITKQKLFNIERFLILKEKILTLNMDKGKEISESEMNELALIIDLLFYLRYEIDSLNDYPIEFYNYLSTEQGKAYNKRYFNHELAIGG